MSSCAHSSPVQENKLAIPQQVSLKVGAQRTELYLPQLIDKKVGIVGNQSSLINQTHLVDTLLSSGVEIIRVFSPEHGFRGDADAGEYVNNQKDAKTGLPIVSLYGSNKKPKQEQLDGIDIIIFDIQDVGVRFYTYISTLHYVMEACAEKGIPVMILDRPNPNGHYVDGPVLDLKYKSFVGMHPVPTVHGMTIGEYGKMINGEAWLEGGLKCELEVVPCQNYTHQTAYSLPVAPSPNLRSDAAIQLYPSLCLLEATDVTVGRGTDGPFERYGHPKFPKTEFSFIPKSGYGSKSPKHEGEVCFGYNLKDSVDKRVDGINLNYLINAYNLLGDNMFKGHEKMFNLLAGNGELMQQVKSGMNEVEIKKTWESSLAKYKNETRTKYLIYPN